MAPWRRLKVETVLQRLGLDEHDTPNLGALLEPLGPLLYHYNDPLLWRPRGKLLVYRHLPV